MGKLLAKLNLVTKNAVYQITGIMDNYDQTRAELVATLCQTPFNLSALDPRWSKRIGCTTSDSIVQMRALTTEGLFQPTLVKEFNLVQLDFCIEPSGAVIAACFTLFGQKDRFFLVPNKFWSCTVASSSATTLGNITITFPEIRVNKPHPSLLIYAHRSWSQSKNKAGVFHEQPFIVEPRYQVPECHWQKSCLTFCSSHRFYGQMSLMVKDKAEKNNVLAVFRKMFECQ